MCPLRRLVTGPGIHTVRVAIPENDPQAVRNARSAFVSAGTSFEQTLQGGSVILLATHMTPGERRLFCAWYERHQLQAPAPSPCR